MMPRLEAKLPLCANSRSCRDFEAPNSVLIIYLQMNLKNKNKWRNNESKMGGSFQHGCLHACIYDKSWGGGWVNAQNPELQDITLRILLIHSSEDHLSLVLHMAHHKGFLMALSPLLLKFVVPALIKVSTSREQAWNPFLKWLLWRACVTARWV